MPGAVTATYPGGKHILDQLPFPSTLLVLPFNLLFLAILPTPLPSSLLLPLLVFPAPNSMLWPYEWGGLKKCNRKGVPRGVALFGPLRAPSRTVFHPSPSRPYWTLWGSVGISRTVEWQSELHCEEKVLPLLQIFTANQLNQSTQCKCFSRCCMKNIMCAPFLGAAVGSAGCNEVDPGFPDIPLEELKLRSATFTRPWLNLGKIWVQGTW